MNNNELKKGDLVGNILFKSYEKVLCQQPKQLNLPLSPYMIGSPPKSVTIQTEKNKIIFANNIDFCYSKIGILIEEKTLVYGVLQTEDIKLPLSIKCWGVWCGEKVEHWRSED